MADTASSEPSATTAGYPSCPCGGQSEYFGEALTSSLTCDQCGESLIVVGWSAVATIQERWIRGDRGSFEVK